VQRHIDRTATCRSHLGICGLHHSSIDHRNWQVCTEEALEELAPVAFLVLEVYIPAFAVFDVSHVLAAYKLTQHTRHALDTSGLAKNTRDHDV